MEPTSTADDRQAESFLRVKKRLTSTLLTLFPAAMVGKRVRVTLLDDTEVLGRLAFVDGFLNMELDSSVLITPPGEKVANQRFEVASRLPITHLLNID